jgi:hypothetical protein
MTAPSPALQELRQTRKQIDALCERIYARCREAAPELFAQLEPLIKREETLRALVVREEVAK